jgi:hypothetical protein
MTGKAYMEQKESRAEELVLLQAKLPRHLRDEFMQAVKDADDNASRLIRLWVRDYLRGVGERKAQPDLFESARQAGN